MERPLRLAQIGWLVIPALGITELGLDWHYRGRAPDLGAWAEVREAVAELRTPGDPVIVAPGWAEPNARYTLGDELMPLGEVARAEIARYRRVVELGILGERSQETAAFRVLETRHIGAFELRLLENPAPVRVLFDFVEAFVETSAGGTLSVALEGEPRLPCPFTDNARVTNGALSGHPTFPAERFKCPGGEWSFVGVTVIEDEHYRPRRCLWAHPGESPVITRFENVPLGESLVGYGGLPYFFARDQLGTPVEVDVSVDGASIGTYSHRDGQGWTRFSFDTRAWQGSRRSVAFRVSSAQAKRREFCFYADTRESASPEAFAGRSATTP